jgi:hypothetical protein
MIIYDIPSRLLCVDGVLHCIRWLLYLVKVKCLLYLNVWY